MRAKIRVRGIVQGVGFRPFIYRIAIRHNLTGYVRNQGDAGVEILLEGDKEDINQFKKDLTEKKPSQASIYQVIIQPLKGENRFKEFRIIRSSEKIGLSGSVIPPDIAICEECLKELRDVKNPRYGYFFITCTDCGPRYTIIKKVPYDRETTTMSNFPLCKFCEGEYRDPVNRRFHAQTVACSECGPKVYLTDKYGIQVESKNPIQEAGKLIAEGSIVAIKGYGGFHVAASTLIDAPLKHLREVKHRSQ